MKQNAKANTICQPVTQTKTLNHENVSTKITENITQNSSNIDASNSSKAHKAINEKTKKISIPSDLIGNLIGKNGHLQCEDSYKISKQKYSRRKSDRK